MTSISLFTKQNMSRNRKFKVRGFFTIRVLRVTFFGNRVKVIGTVLKVGCPLQEEKSITFNIYIFFST